LRSETGRSPLAGVGTPNRKNCVLVSGHSCEPATDPELTFDAWELAPQSCHPDAAALTR
jgi:hypothetical protein